MALLLAISLILLTGCDKAIEEVETTITETISDISNKITPPQEFTRLETPEGRHIYTADMYDGDTVIMMLEGEYSGEFNLGKYSLSEKKYRLICSGELENSTGESNHFMTTLCSNPLVIADTAQEVIYKFSGDFTKVDTVVTTQLDTYSYRYSRQRDSIIYTRSDNAHCELREYSMGDYMGVTLVDLSRDYSYVWLEDYLEDAQIAVLSASRLFGSESCKILVDLKSMAVIGETSDEMAFYSTANELDLISFDIDTADVTMAKLTADSSVREMLNDRADQGGGTVTASRYNGENSVGRVTEGGYVFEFSSREGGKCGLEMYDVDGSLFRRGEFSVGEFTTIDMENEIPPAYTGQFGDGEPLSVYISCSQTDAYAAGKLVFGLAAGEHIGSVVVWDTSLAELVDLPLTDRAEVTFSVTRPEVKEYQDSNTAYAQELEEKFGVNIFYGDEADLEYVDYTVEPAYDESDIRRGLEALEEAMSLFPEGFFRDFREQDVLRGINIYFSQSMTPYSDTSIDQAAAFTYTVYGTAVMVLNVEDNGYVVNNICHEFMHIIDTRLLDEGILDEEVWNSFNPEGFEYNYGYKSEDGEDYTLAADSTYTAGDDDYYMTGDADYVYFVDAYSKTYPTEDRARLFEYAAEAENGLPDYFESEKIQAKLGYLFDCIRQSWNTEGWPETTSWEAALN